MLEFYANQLAKNAIQQRAKSMCEKTKNKKAGYHDTASFAG